MPEVPCTALSGFAFSQAISSCKLFAGIVFFATISCGVLTSSDTGSKSFNKSLIEWVDSTVRHVRARAAVAERVAIGRRVGNPASADPAGGATHVFDNNRLTKGRAHAFS